MTQLITGGIVSVEDGTKKSEEFAPARKVRVELHFDVPEGTDEGHRMLDSVAALADAKVKELLGHKPAAKAAAPKPEVAAALAAVETTLVPGSTAAVQNAKTKDDLAREAGVSVGVVDGPKAPKPPGRPRKAQEAPPAPVNDPAAMVEEPAPEPTVDDFSVEPEVPAEIISDDEINRVVKVVNDRLGGPSSGAPVQIKTVIARFRPADWGNKQFTLRDIPQAVRQEFKDELKALLPDEQRKGL